MVTTVTWKPSHGVDFWGVDGGPRQVGKLGWCVGYVANQQVSITGRDLDRLSPLYTAGQPLHPMVAVCWYAAAHQQIHGAFTVERKSERLLCTSPDYVERHSTTVWAGCTYVEFERGFLSVDAALYVAASYAEAHTTGHIDWDGQPWR